jgi:hypothetical protein
MGGGIVAQNTRNETAFCNRLNEMSTCLNKVACKQEDLCVFIFGTIETLQIAAWLVIGQCSTRAQQESDRRTSSTKH